MSFILRSTLIALLVALAAPFPAMAQRDPSEVELKALYCVPLIRRDLQTLKPLELGTVRDNAELKSRPGVTQQQIQDHERALHGLQRYVQDLESTQDRLRSFILPRSAAIDPAALEAAIRRGEADVRLLDERAPECGRLCPLDAPPDCSSKCMGEELISRAKDCRSARWLPF